MYNFFIIIVSVLLNASAQLFLKKGATALTAFNHHSMGVMKSAISLINPGIMAGFACYAASILLWIYALSRVEVSYAYPFQALGYIFVILTSYFLFHETITPAKIAGMVLIATGVFCIARG